METQEIEGIKYLIEKVLNDEERFLFINYFSLHFRLKDLRRFYKLKKLGYPYDAKGVQASLAKACIKFLGIPKIHTDISLKSLLRLDTYRYNIHDIMFSQNENKEVFGFIYEIVEKYTVKLHFFGSLQ